MMRRMSSGGRRRMMTRGSDGCDGMMCLREWVGARAWALRRRGRVCEVPRGWALGKVHDDRREA